MDLAVRYVHVETDVASLRLIAISLATITGVLIGLISTTLVTIVRVALSQKQFYQSVLAEESQWLTEWFTLHRMVIGQPSVEVEDTLNAIYRHTATPEVTDKELISQMANTLLPLPNEWRETTPTLPSGARLKQYEINEFERHLDGTGAIISQIKVSKDRMRIGGDLSFVLWPLGGVLLISLIVVLLCSISNINTFMSNNAFLFAIALIVIAIIIILSLIYIVTLFMRTEAEEIHRVVTHRLVRRQRKVED